MAILWVVAVLWGSSISWVASESIFIVSAYALGYFLYRVCSLDVNEATTKSND